MVNNNGTTRTYNAANQMTHDGTNTLSYDNNGNLTGDGVNAYTWDRANRLLTAPGSTSYKYDGLSNRIQQTVSSVVTDYLNDVQPGLVKLLRQGNGSNVDHFIHAPRGIHAVDDGTDWNWYMQDGLGSVRGLVDDAAAVVSSHSYSPIGVPDSDYDAGFWFTGEQTDENDNIYLRARYMNLNLGTFLSLDPFEGLMQRPMSLNGYSWVEGNVVNAIDPSGKCWDHPTTTPTQQNQCLDAWNTYVSGIDLSDSTLRDLVRQEDSYWGSLNYGDFINLWNDNRLRPPLSYNRSSEIAQGSLGIGATVAFSIPIIGYDDVAGAAIALGGLCLAGIVAVAAVAGVGTIALPQRQPINWGLPSVEGTPGAIPIPDDRDIPRPTVTPDNCNRETIRQRIGIQTVGQVVGITPVKSGEPDVSREGVIDWAVSMCRNENVPPAQNFVAGDNVDLPNIVLSDGNHRFVASRLMNYPLAIVPSPSPFAVIEEDDLDFFQFYEWSVMHWREG